LALLAQPADTPFKMIASCNRETQVTFLCTGAPSGYLKSHFYILGLPRGTASNISIHWGSLGVPQITFLYTGAPSGRGTSSHISIDWGSLGVPQVTFLYTGALSCYFYWQDLHYKLGFANITV